jgi:hypothetical protein
MIKQSFVTAALFATLLFGGASQASAAAPPPAAARPQEERSAPQSEPGDYAQREDRSRELETFKGGEREHIYIGSTIVVVLLVVLVVVLVL